MREKGFLNWYERWLREVIVGYNDEEIGFGMNLDGDPGQLMELYQQTEDPTLLIYAVWCTEGVENRQLQELYVELMDKYRTYENTKFDYKGSQMVLKGGACLGASRPEGQLTSNLMRRQMERMDLGNRKSFREIFSIKVRRRIDGMYSGMPNASVRLSWVMMPSHAGRMGFIE